MDKPIKLVDKSEDCRHWSVRDMLEDAIRLLDEAGMPKPTKAFLVMVSPQTSDLDMISHIYFKAGLADIHDTLGLLALTQSDIAIQFVKED